MKPRDASYKAIFTHPEIIQQLPQDFVKQDWVKQLNFSTLEKTNNPYVSENLREPFDYGVESALATAKSMLAEGLDIKTVIKITGLTKEMILQ